MARFIIEVENELDEVDESTYDGWIAVFGEQYKLPVYKKEVNGNCYAIETMFQGAMDKGKGDYPFILFYFEDINSIVADGIHTNIDNDRIEYFDSFNELKKRRQEIISEMEAKIES